MLYNCEGTVLTGFPSATTSSRRVGLAKALENVGRPETRLAEQSRKRRAFNKATQSMETSSLPAIIEMSTAGENDRFSFYERFRRACSLYTTGAFDPSTSALARVLQE